MVGGGDPFYLKFWVNRPPPFCSSKIAYFEPIFPRSVPAVTRSEKKFLTLMGSPLRAF